MTSHSRRLRATISGRRICLRPLKLDHPEIVYEAIDRSREHLARWMPWCHANYALADCRQYVELQSHAWQQGEEFALSIVEATHGAFLGGTGINFIDWANRRANLGYWIRSDRVGRGLATEAVRLLAPAALHDLALERIEILAVADNRASRRVAEKAGATYEGILRKRLRTGDGQCDAACYSFARADFDLPPA